MTTGKRNTIAKTTEFRHHRFYSDFDTDVTRNSDFSGKGICKNNSTCENAVARKWGSCTLRVMGSSWLKLIGWTICLNIWRLNWILSRADPKNSERGGRVPHPPPPPTLQMKTLLFRTCSIQQFCDAKLINNVSEDRIKEHFIKRFSKIVEHFKNTRKKWRPDVNETFLIKSVRTNTKYNTIIY